MYNTDTEETRTITAHTCFSAINSFFELIHKFRNNRQHAHIHNATFYQ